MYQLGTCLQERNSVGFQEEMLIFKQVLHPHRLFIHLNMIGLLEISNIQLVNLIDTAIKTSSKVEAIAYTSNLLASFQANSAALCDPNPCHESECIVDFLAGSFMCNCNPGYYGNLIRNS